MDAPPSGSAAAAALTRPLALPYTLTPAFSANTGPVVVLMSGWPDRPATLFASLLRRLAAAGYRPATVELPGYAADAAHPLPPRWWGWDFPQITAGYAAAVRAIQEAAAGGGAGEGGAAATAAPPAPLAPVTFVTHDWGAAVTWQLVAAHPTLARAIVGADVGDAAGLAAVHLAFCALYMSALAALFVLGGPAGDAGTRWLARVLGAPHPAEAAARMNAPYYWTVRRQVAGLWRWLTGVGRGEGGLGGPSVRLGAVPACPTMYLYGTKKGTFQYHSREWIANLNARPDCKVVPMADAHWLMAGPTAAEYEEAVLGWLATTIGPRGGAPAGAAPVAAAPVAAVGTAAAPAEEGKKDL